jgi:hypothetical protein
VQRPKLLADLISNDELQNCIKKEFLSPKVSQEEAVDKFYLREFSVEDMIQCLEHPTFNLVTKDSGWFTRLYVFLQVS